MKSRKSTYVLAGAALVVAGVIAYVAYRTRAVPTPRRRWKRFESKDAIPLDEATCKTLQGLYTVEEGTDFFGETAVLKCSYTVVNNKTVFHLSLFCEKNGTYIISEARKQGGAVLLSGHWRKAAANGSGIVWLAANNAQGNNTGSANIIIQGLFGDGDSLPDQTLRLRYRQPLPENHSLQIIGHRGGARNVDFLHLSENTTDMMKLAAQLGATGVEIDVRMTKDGVPVIFHDSFLSIHTVKKKIYGGLIHNYTLKELQAIKLRKGGTVPTLQECLHTILYETPLETVWLDIKKECDLVKINKLQNQYMERAATIGRKLTIYIGVPDKSMLACFKELDDYKNIPSLTELEPEVATEINAEVWAPQYTNGTEEENVARMHNEERKAFVWSLDSRFMIDTYLKEGGFDGVVTNTPSVVAHWYYTNLAKGSLDTNSSMHDSNKR
ncbi:MAG TPA: glycerophosphodiester phosphodiesterase family protein [Flavisolibacter sp.]|nr:glycerophosphodiester phosphodiesterase family protein [Flavisolibacter sp.]